MPETTHETLEAIEPWRKLHTPSCYTQIGEELGNPRSHRSQALRQRQNISFKTAKTRSLVHHIVLSKESFLIKKNALEDVFIFWLDQYLPKPIAKWPQTAKQIQSEWRFSCSTANARPGGTCMLVQKPQSVRQWLKLPSASDEIATKCWLLKTFGANLIVSEPIWMSHVQWRPRAVALLRRAWSDCKEASDSRKTSTQNWNKKWKNWNYWIWNRIILKESKHHWAKMRY